MELRLSIAFHYRLLVIEKNIQATLVLPVKPRAKLVASDSNRWTESNETLSFSDHYQLFIDILKVFFSLPKVSVLIFLLKAALNENKNKSRAYKKLLSIFRLD